MSGTTTVIKEERNSKGFVKLSKNEGCTMIGRGNCLTVWGNIGGVGMFTLSYKLTEEERAENKFKEYSIVLANREGGVK
ncbi:hypothetical protein ACW5UC_25370 [Priestia aryabhattai]|uniref:hypothetical protein n=1 Tax=Priestia megaterium TaxID=1404 RepID=UPI003F9AA534